MKRILALVALAFLVAIGITAQSPMHRPSGIPKHIGAWSKVSGEARNAFGLLAPPQAHATLPGFRWVHDAILWRTNRDGTIVDSTIVTVSNTDFSSDTTAAFPLERLYMPFDGGVTTAVVDSLTTMTFCLGGVTSAPSIDSVYVGMQVSIDGISWVSTTVSGGPAGTFLADAFVSGKPPIASAGVIEATTSNQLCLDYNLLMPAIPKYGGNWNGATAPSDQMFYGWKFARWIVTWSLVDETDVLQAWVGHYTAAPPPGGY